MTESEAYWLSIIEELEAITGPLRPAGDLPVDEPQWVLKLTLELLNMLSPKMQLRVGNRPTPDKMGALVGSYLVQLAQSKAHASLPKPQSDAGKSAFAMGLKLATPPGFASNWYEIGRAKIETVEKRVHEVITKILRDRPLPESSEFFRGFSRGLKQNVSALVPTIEHGRPAYTREQFNLIKRVTIYMGARHNWRELDALHTSQQAFDWFTKRVPAPFLGDDPERIRKMFYRVGKQFKAPGRPKKGTPLR